MKEGAMMEGREKIHVHVGGKGKTRDEVWRDGVWRDGVYTRMSQEIKMQCTPPPHTHTHTTHTTHTQHTLTAIIDFLAKHWIHRYSEAPMFIK